MCSPPRFMVNIIHYHNFSYPFYLFSTNFIAFPILYIFFLIKRTNETNRLLALFLNKVGQGYCLKLENSEYLMHITYINYLSLKNPTGLVF